MWTNGSGSEVECHYVRFVSRLSQERHIQILKCFHSELIYSVVSDCHENNKVKEFLAQNFWLGCVTLRSYCVFDRHPQLWRNSFFKKVAALNLATLLRIEFLCVSFFKSASRIIGRPKSSTRIEDLIALTSLLGSWMLR